MTSYGCLRPRFEGPGDGEHSGGHSQKIPDCDTGREDRVGSLLGDPRSKIGGKRVGES